jgi:small-conductance mechanosensitive channel/CRP-like cAMP-binding protein
LIAGLVLMVLALAVRSASVNRHIRTRAFVSALLFAGYAIIATVIARAQLDATVVRQLRFLETVFVALGVINLIVTSAINPWRVDRLPDQFPTIVQDAIIIVLFAIVATVTLRGEFLATTAVGAVVIGLALQETLGNLFAGLAIEIEKPFRVGHWVDVGGHQGLVSEITWRATKFRTKSGNLVVIPNSAIARETIINYSEPTLHLRLEVEVGASYDAPPNEVKTTIRAAVADEPLLDHKRDVEVLMVDFAASAITYRVRMWTTDFAADELIKDRTRTRIYYAFRRAGISIPYPIEVQIQGEGAPPARIGANDQMVDILKRTDIFSTLSDSQLADLIRAARVAVYGVGESIVTQGQEGSSMFVLCRGEASVAVVGSSEVLAHLSVGDCVGEMSLLTGDRRSATARAVTDCEVIEITADNFRRLVQQEPSLLDRVVGMMTSRRVELERHKAAIAPDEATAGPASTFLARARRFFGLSAT